MPKICVMGYLSIDSVTTLEGAWADAPGGGALYAALGARAAGAEAAIVANVGEDLPQLWLDELAALDIDVSRVVRKGGPTRRARLSHARDGDRLSPHHDDAVWQERTLALAPRLDAALDADMLVLCPMPADAAAAALAFARCPAFADTSAAFAGTERDALLALLPWLACFAPSLEETRILLPELGDDDALLVLAATGAAVVQKRGADGLACCPPGSSRIEYVAAPRTIVVDPTGAGDATVGALAAGFAEGLSLIEAAAQAVLIGARTVAGRGPSGLGFSWTAATRVEAA